MGKGKGGCDLAISEALSYSRAESELTKQGPRKRSVKRRKTVSPEKQAERRDQVNAQVKELEGHIQEAIENPQKITDWIKEMRSGELWRYSYGNIGLARSQAHFRSMEITRLAGFRRWEQLGYQVEKGQKGLHILAPKNYLRKDPKTKQPLLDNNGKKQYGIYFGSVSVFDISQCRPILDENGNPLNTDLESTPAAEQAVSELCQIASEQGIDVYRGGISDPNHPDASKINATLVSDPSAGGFFTEIDKRPIIVTRPGLSEQEEARVLAHELGHALMHSGRSGYKDHDDRARKEAEAESAAYIISGQYGLSEEGQANYVAHWISSLDKKLEEQLKEEGVSGPMLRAEIKERKRWMVRDTMGNIQGAVRLVMERASEIRSH